MKAAFANKRSESREILAEDPVSGSSTPYGTSTPGDGELRLAAPKDPGKGQWWPMQRRHYVALMAFLGFFNIYALRANLSIAILEMVRNVTIRGADGVVVQFRGEFHYWSSFTTGLILSAFFYGYILTQLPGGWWAARVGGVKVYALGVLSTSLLTLLTPPLAHFGAPVLIIVRVLEGLAEGVTYPAIHAVWRHWAPPMEKTRLATFAFAGSYFGNAVSMPVSAWLGAHFGWPSIFYVFGLLALGWVTLWWKTVAKSPSEDPRISPEELAYITQSIGFTPEQVQDLRPPWREIAKSRAVWAIIAAHFAENWGFYTMLTYLPMFVKNILHYPIQKTGLVSALPYAAMGTVVILGGQVADHFRAKRNWETGRVRKLCVCTAFGAQAAFLLLMAHAPVPSVAVGCLTVAVGVGGLAWAGFSVNHLDIAPQYASVLMGVSNTVATLPGMIAPALVGAVVRDKGDVWEWRLVFYVVAAIYALGGAVFYLFASGDVQEWALLPGGYVSQLGELDSRLEEGADPKREE